MNPVKVSNSVSDDDMWKYAYKDAIYFSGHKFLGGPGCPGVLVVKKHILSPRECRFTSILSSLE